MQYHKLPEERHPYFDSEYVAFEAILIFWTFETTMRSHAS